MRTIAGSCTRPLLMSTPVIMRIIIPPTIRTQTATITHPIRTDTRIRNPRHSPTVHPRHKRRRRKGASPSTPCRRSRSRATMYTLETHGAVSDFAAPFSPAWSSSRLRLQTFLYPAQNGRGRILRYGLVVRLARAIATGDTHVRDAM
jgi:hypothetical protein